MGTDGGPRAWAFLRRNPVYQAAWRDASGRTVFEPAPFAVRIQLSVDRQALAWGSLAWEDPNKTDGPASPFWAEAPMLNGEWGIQAPPLAQLIANAGARLSGLRMADGTLILKIEKRREAAQVRMRPGRVHTRPGLDSGVATGLVLRHAFGSERGQAVERFEEVESLLQGNEPDTAHPADRELLTVLDGRLAGKSWRETAIDLYGAERVVAEWNTESWMRSRVRRRGKKARFLMERGYRSLAAAR